MASENRRTRPKGSGKQFAQGKESEPAVPVEGSGKQFTPGEVADQRAATEGSGKQFRPDAATVEGAPVEDPSQQFEGSGKQFARRDEPAGDDEGDDDPID